MVQDKDRPPLKTIAADYTLSDTALSPEDCAEILTRLVEPARVLTRPIDRIVYAADASFYRLIPKRLQGSAARPGFFNELDLVGYEAVLLRLQHALAVESGELVQLKR